MGRVRFLSSAFSMSFDIHYGCGKVKCIKNITFITKWAKTVRVCVFFNAQACLLKTIPFEIYSWNISATKSVFIIAIFQTDKLTGLWMCPQGYHAMSKKDGYLSWSARFPPPWLLWSCCMFLCNCSMSVLPVRCSIIKITEARLPCFPWLPHDRH